MTSQAVQQILTTDDFNFDAKTKVMSQDLSMLEHKGFGCGRTFYIKSTFTGKVEQFRYKDTVYDSSGEDIQYWLYIPVNANVSANVEKLYIWND